ncbi:transcription termination factor NusA [Candidatus Nitrosacidococcus tergens]|uniref:Transcription termination/antitermination protein NusA n=1 Tax=Candidatus Nitrosacidococcus tergens TaxID=553981 RepID=A0A7G1Q8T1_9GAMM|nr:transcription termination factor NusA [Candidatus Nitrosacidococcus tergens]CAB1275253.1 transcription termination/antitermination L factor [Candidatus Nitrosacidococcus tergens]
MNKEILMVVDAVSHEKGVDKEVIFQALEAALVMATRKRYSEDIAVRVVIDRITGEYESFRVWEVVENEESIEFPHRQVSFSKAQDQSPNTKLGEFIEDPIGSIEFGRIAAQTAKQVIVQKIREAEQAQIFEIYRNQIGKMIVGVVKRTTQGNIILDFGDNTEGIILREEMIPRETVRHGDRLRCYLKDVRGEGRGPQLIVSRVAPELLIELFKLEVPEISENRIEIKGAARDPGVRAKIAVKTNESRIDPIGACVGMRGSRVQAISNELAGERIDIVLWDEDPTRFVINVMAPAEISSIVVDEENHSMDIAVAEENLSQAIGRSGQNIRLATQLTGWSLKVMTEQEAGEIGEAENEALQKLFTDQLNVEKEIAAILVHEGFSSIEEIAYVPEQELLAIDEFDQEIVKDLRGRARDVLLSHSMNGEESQTLQPNQDLLTLEGIDKVLADKFAMVGIFTRDDLAEQAVDDLIEIEGVDREQAARLIMAAREAWFANE